MLKLLVYNHTYTSGKDGFYVRYIFNFPQIFRVENNEYVNREQILKSRLNYY